MVDGNKIESVLRMNGLGPSDPDEKIRSVLLSASFTEDEVATAIMVLRQNTKTNETRVDGLHKIFRTDQALKPHEISALLGIDINLSSRVQASANARRYTLIQVIILWLASLVIASAAVLLYMYSHQIGLFHPASDILFAFENE